MRHCQKYTQETFIARCKEVWGDRYDLSLVEFNTVGEKIAVICPKHGVWYIVASSFLKGHGCRKCATEEFAKKHSRTTEQFIEEAKAIHGDRYDYSQVVYKNSQTPVTIICHEHGAFKMKPVLHLNRKSNCPKCMNCGKHSNEDFIKKAQEVHGDKYDYSLVDYVSKDKKVTIICPEHGIFEQTPHHHLRGGGCPLCNESKGEREIARILDSKNITYHRGWSFKDCKYKYILKFDFYLPDYNCCIEYQGIQHYKPFKWWGGKNDFKKRQERDQIKRDYCKTHEIRLEEIRYDEDLEARLSDIFNINNIKV